MRVVATNAGGSTPASSLPSAPVAPDPPANVDLPTTSGTTRDGQTLTAGAGVWTGSPVIDFTYQWQRCDAAGDNCSDISGATGSDYGLTPRGRRPDAARRRHRHERRRHRLRDLAPPPR